MNECQCGHVAFDHAYKSFSGAGECGYVGCQCRKFTPQASAQPYSEAEELTLP